MKKFVWSILFAPFFMVSQTTNDHNQVINQQNRTEEPKSRFAIEINDYKDHKLQRDFESTLGCLERVGRIMSYCFQKTGFFYVDHKQLEISDKEKNK